MGCTVYVAKTKALVSCTVTADMAFVSHMLKAGFLMTQLISVHKMRKCFCFFSPQIALQVIRTYSGTGPKLYIKICGGKIAG